MARGGITAALGPRHSCVDSSRPLSVDDCGGVNVHAGTGCRRSLDLDDLRLGERGFLAIRARPDDPSRGGDRVGSCFA